MDVSRLIEKAKQAAGCRQFSYASDLCSQACKMSPNDGDARKALRSFQATGAKLDPPAPFSAFWANYGPGGLWNAIVIRILTLFKKWESVADKAEDILRADPLHSHTILRLGVALANCGHLNAAVAVLDSMSGLADDKHKVAGLRRVALLHEELGNHQDAVGIWESIVKAQPGDRQATTKLRDLAAGGVSRMIEKSQDTTRRGSIARSLQSGTQRSESDAADADRTVVKTVDEMLATVENLKERIKQVSEGWEMPIRSATSPLYEKMGDLYKRFGYLPEAIVAYKEASSRSDNPTYLFKCHDAEIALAQKNLDYSSPRDVTKFLESKLESYVEREKQYPTDSRIRFESGCVHFELASSVVDPVRRAQLYQYAIQRFQQTARDPKFKADSMLKMGLAFRAVNKNDLAIKRFLEALAGDLVPVGSEKWKELKYHLAKTLEDSGSMPDAKAIYSEIYEIDVSYKDVGEKIA